ncbi:MAG: tripartite tricarboxylate transporter TctB family protein [Candidatus Accumulibacter sp.]|jgi:hypothetical protein|nr:tripartite tricarboxylate transporter TctB family protein [Accumulibacter sp.]
MAMEDRHKDTVFGVILFVFGAWVTAESVRMIGQAAGPPLRIKQLSVSPGLLPLVLGLILMFLAVLLAASSLKGVENPGRALAGRLKGAVLASRAAFGDRDFRSMLAGLVMMFAYCYLFVGNVPFWGGAFIFLLVIMSFLRQADRTKPPARAADFGLFALVSAAVVGIVVLLFENIFGTVLP